MKKLLTLALSAMLLVCTFAGFTGCAKNDHNSPMVWKHDATSHWLECEDCGHKADVNKQLYSSQDFITNISANSLYIPAHWNTPDAYAQGLGYADFAEYIAENNQGTAPHVYNAKGECICGATNNQQGAGYMLKQKRVEFHSAVCYICTMIFIAVALLCLMGNYAFLDRANARMDGGEHIVMHYTGYALVKDAFLPIDYLYDFSSVTGMSNLILLIVMAVLGGILSLRQEAFKKSLIMIDICYVIAIVMTIFAPLQIMSRIIYLFEDNVNTLDYSFGFIPWISAVVCVATYIVFKIFYKDGYARKPGKEPKYAPGMFKKNNEVVETAVVLPEGDAEVVTPESEVVEVFEPAEEASNI